MNEPCDEMTPAFLPYPPSRPHPISFRLAIESSLAILLSQFPRRSRLFALRVLSPPKSRCSPTNLNTSLTYSPNNPLSPPPFLPPILDAQNYFPRFCAYSLRPSPPNGSCQLSTGGVHPPRNIPTFIVPSLFFRLLSRVKFAVAAPLTPISWSYTYPRVFPRFTSNSLFLFSTFYSFHFAPPPPPPQENTT